MVCWSGVVSAVVFCSRSFGKATDLHGRCLRPRDLTANWRYQRLLRGVHPLDGDQVLPEPSWLLGPTASKEGGPRLPPSMQSQTFEPLPQDRAGATIDTFAAAVSEVAGSLVGTASLEPWFRKKRAHRQNLEEKESFSRRFSDRPDPVLPHFLVVGP